MNGCAGKSRFYLARRQSHELPTTSLAGVSHEDSSALVSATGGGMSVVSEAIETMAKAEKEIYRLRARNSELLLQVEILTDYLEPMSEKLCRCENNGDYCDFHAMLEDAKTSMKGCANANR